MALGVVATSIHSAPVCTFLFALMSLSILSTKEARTPIWDSHTIAERVWEFPSSHHPGSQVLTSLSLCPYPCPLSLRPSFVQVAALTPEHPLPGCLLVSSCSPCRLAAEGAPGKQLGLHAPAGGGGISAQRLLAINTSEKVEGGPLYRKGGRPPPGPFLAQM